MYQYLLLLDTDEEKEFFQKIYIRYKNEMFYAAFAILQNSADAEDIVHDTFLTLIDKLNHMMEEPTERNWNYILTIVKHKSYNLYKKKKWEIDQEWDSFRQDDVFGEGMDARITKLERKEQLLKLMKKMRQSYQDVLIMQYYQELNIMEIAQILGKTPDNIRHISMRAKRKLQGILEENGFFD